MIFHADSYKILHLFESTLTISIQIKTTAVFCADFAADVHKGSWASRAGTLASGL